jgi:hypothetical protein
MLTTSTKHCKAFFPCIVIGSHIETREPAELVKFKVYDVPDTKLHHEVMCRNGGRVPHILNSSPDAGEFSVSRPPPPPNVKVSSTHWVGDWVCPTVDAEAAEKRNISYPYPDCRFIGGLVGIVVTISTEPPRLSCQSSENHL